ncbi:MAG: hypothetical protein FWD23_18665 [Oscillospiraceae bacterium]|nr:hypothetical protein [Oscillospiraceae bacterium]
MAKTTATQNIEDNPYVKELLEVLKKHNAPGAEELQSMITNTAKIEQQLAAAVTEMTAMRRELAAIREDNHPMRNALQNAVTAMQEQIRALREQLETLKANIIDGCKNALAAFKERGAAALNGIAKFFEVKPALEAIAKSCDRAAENNSNAINKIESISNEYHKAGQHLKNIGRVMTGKDLLTSAKPAGKVAKTAEAPLKAARACNIAMRNAARNAVKSLTRLEETVDRPKPIKEQFDAAAKKAAAHNARSTPDKTKNTPGVEL